jgi:glyoxylase-like metal-dependent hydrolase (beta-lactamase superfamily II)
VRDGKVPFGTSDLERWQYITSMERLLQLPVRVVHGGHFPSYSGDRHRQLITDWLQAKGR